MAITTRVRRLANPFRKTRTRAAGARRAKRRSTARNPRKLSLLQKLHFGTKRQRNGAKASLARKRRLKAANPRRRKPTATATRRRVSNPRRHHSSKRRSNPALVVTLGAMNPERGKMTRKRRSRKANPRRHRRNPLTASRPVRRRRRRVNPIAAPRRRHVSRRRRRANPVVHHIRRRRVNARAYGRRRRNPIELFGPKRATDIAQMIGGGLIGVAGTKLALKYMPTSITSAASSWGSALASAVSAYALGWAGSRFLNPTMGSAILFGGLMQTGSVVLNLLVPNLAVNDVSIALSGLRGKRGMGELIAGKFVVPQNPITAGQSVATAAIESGNSAQVRTSMNGLTRAFGRAF
jgi:hypothetical protein